MIKLDNITLDFPLRQSRLNKRNYKLHQKQNTGGAVMRDGTGHVSVRALENISFTLNSGDRLALLGHNGAGKTTLLRVMSGIYHPTQGQVSSEGEIVPLLSLNFGIDKEATGYENIKMRGLFLGMSQSEIKSKTDSIAAFSGLADFLHLPLHTYSSGMLARLAFAISTHVNADILLLDEVVATGDASFVAQAQEKIEKITEAMGILVLASHSNKFLRQLCNKGLLLEHGKIAAFGPINQVIEAYNVRRQL